MNFRTTGDIQETKAGCTVESELGSFSGVAHLFLFRRDTLRFWFARLDLASDTPISFRDDEKLKLKFNDGTFGFCYESGQNAEMSLQEQHVFLDVVGIGELFPNPLG